MPIIGIDLGTTNSLVSYWSGEEVIIIPNAFGNSFTPSVVSILDKKIVVGELAKERLISHPLETAAAFKRYMGSQKKYTLGNFNFSPEELSSFIIKSLKADAEKYLGASVSEAIISVPAYFNDKQRKATKKAGELAGLKVERIINEPSAAALAYGIDKEEESRFLVFDLGGGTFDVSILEYFEGIMEVKSLAGDNYLGGEDFTRLLFDDFLKTHSIEEELLDEKSRAILWKQAETCKFTLSQEREAEMLFHFQGKEVKNKISRQYLEKISQPLFNRLLKPIERVLRDSSIASTELDAIALVGGATRMPIVHSFISTSLGRFPHCQINPDHAIVIGAGLQAGMKERNAALKEVIITDVSPYTLGTAVRNMDASISTPSALRYLPIIERNTTVPTSRVERVYTVYDQQTKLKIGVFQGESRIPENNVFLGELKIDVPPAEAGIEAADIRFTYDINGILEVEVTSVSTQKTERLIIEENPGEISKEEIEARLKELAELKLHPRGKEENALLLARGERLYEELIGEYREAVARALDYFEAILEKQDEIEIKKAAKEVKTYFDNLEGI